MTEQELPQPSEPDNLILARLRDIRGVLGVVAEDVASIKLRVGMLEAGYASVSLRVDRLDTRLERIERRLGLVEGAGD